jgi:hypothetical protein
LKKVESCVSGCILGLSFGSYIVDVVFCWCCCGVLYCCCCDWLKSNWCFMSVVSDGALGQTVVSSHGYVWH